MSDEDYEIYKILKTENQRAGQNRRQNAKIDFKEASILAAKNGLQLSKCDNEGIRFRLKCKDWIKDIYPGNQRIYCPNPEKSGPFLRLPVSWQLKDVVLAALKENKVDIIKESQEGVTIRSDSCVELVNKEVQKIFQAWDLDCIAKSDHADIISAMTECMINGIQIGGMDQDLFQESLQFNFKGE